MKKIISIVLIIALFIPFTVWADNFSLDGAQKVEIAYKGADGILNTVEFSFTGTKSKNEQLIVLLTKMINNSDTRTIVSINGTNILDTEYARYATKNENSTVEDINKNKLNNNSSDVAKEKFKKDPKKIYVKFNGTYILLKDQPYIKKVGKVNVVYVPIAQLGTAMGLKGWQELKNNDTRLAFIKTKINFEDTLLTVKAGSVNTVISSPNKFVPVKMDGPAEVSKNGKIVFAHVRCIAEMLRLNYQYDSAKKEIILSTSKK